MAVTRRLAQWLDQTRIDARMVLDGLRGVNPNPLITRPERGHDVHRPSATARSARIFRVAELDRPTGDSISFVLEDPAGDPIELVPGQFFTLLVDVDGQTLRRAYSAASSCVDTSRVRLATKRVDGGRVSNYLNDELRQGQLIRALGPSGDFTCAPAPNDARHIILIAGGSGITPMMSIAASIVDLEPGSRVTLIYGNRGYDDIIFRDELAALAERAAGRFAVRHVLSDPPADWTGGVGILEPAVLAPVLDSAEQADDLPGTYYVCGPEPMMIAARQLLVDRGIDADAIHEERFTQPHMRAGANVVPIGAPQTVNVRVAGDQSDITVEPGETILDAGLAAGLPMKYSCAMGGCGACKVKLHDGSVISEEPNCLTATERDKGYVLACVSRPTCASSVEVEE
jgi:ferredoxin-NADP reductase